MRRNRKPWQMTLREFLGDDLVVSPIAAQPSLRLSGSLPRNAEPRECEAAGYDLHVGPNWQMLTVEGEQKPVASYNAGFGLVVDPAHRGRGLGTFLILWRAEHGGRNPAVRRTPQSTEMTRKAHRLIVQRAVRRGDKVPPEVLADYPELP